jgi:hypothetical protein
MQVLKPTSPATEEQLTMVPLPCLSISEFHVACRAKSLSGLWQWFYPNFPLCNQPWSRISFNTGVKHNPIAQK